MYNTEKMDKFKASYEANLAKAMEQNPEQYMIKDAKLVAGRMFEHMIEGIRRVNIDGKGFKLTAKEFGIKNTYKAWEEWFNA